ncbi:hypothetical protein JKP88DRAFT_262529 [Tribonema minus]|uniref:Tudor domain-containing protein n=1 Tax=Tribonema minus TaxID=303371 RepID=A0A835Z3A3_9STRA|nr:hypothetical protein JKP88DRAFT_262529 [Tribonema minus]
MSEAKEEAKHHDHDDDDTVEECKHSTAQHRQAPAGVFGVGSVVERDIDAIWYPAEVLAVREDACGAAGAYVYDIAYLDDGNTEHDVAARDLRLLDGAASRELAAAAARRGDAARPQQPPVAIPSALLRSIEDLSVNGGADDGDAAPQPTVTYHTSAAHDNRDDGQAGAYIINGPDTNIAAGSGLRALRWLRG